MKLNLINWGVSSSRSSLLPIYDLPVCSYLPKPPRDSGIQGIMPWKAWTNWRVLVKEEEKEQHSHSSPSSYCLCCSRSQEPWRCSCHAPTMICGGREFKSLHEKKKKTGQEAMRCFSVPDWSCKCSAVDEAKARGLVREPRTCTVAF